MNPDEFARTIEARLIGDPDLAQTLVRRPGGTIEPRRHASSGGVGALEALRQLSGVLDGKIDIHQTIGEGGMGVVHLATQSTLGRHVAVKTLRAGSSNIDATLRMLREAWVTGGLEHPNIVPVYDVGVDTLGAPVIVMKRVEGRCWSDLHRDHEALAALFVDADPLEANLRIFVAVCNAIQFAHSRGILHRDIKPENVMIGSFGEVYVLDWGIAVSMNDDPSGRLPLASQATEIAGTPSYMAPEMLLGDPSALSVRTDVYLLGAVLYEIFAGEPPHAGSSLQAMITSVLLSEPAFPDGFPSEAKHICRRALSRDSAMRYSGAEALRLAVEEYLRHRGSRRLAREAKQSLNELLRTLSDETPSEERTLAVFNLLGECRFGYRAALSAWPGNEAAQRGLDRALLGVIDHELTEGDAGAAATLLREVKDPPPGTIARVEAALKARSDEDDRLRKIGQDLDPEVGGRTRSFIAAIFGVLWLLTPLVSWLWERQGHPLTHAGVTGGSGLFLVLGLLLYWWAKETLTKTRLNRRLGQTFGLHLVAQMVLGVGTYAAGMTPRQNLTLHIFAWCLSQTLLSVWVSPWLAISAVLSAVAFVVASAYPDLLYPSMAIDNLLFTALLVKVWLPQQDVERVLHRRAELRQRARRLFLDMSRRKAVSDDES